MPLGGAPQIVATQPDDLAAPACRPDLSPDQRLRIAGALGDMGGNEACRLLRDMQGATPIDERELHHEIEIALRAADC